MEYIYTHCSLDPLCQLKHHFIPHFVLGNNNFGMKIQNILALRIVENFPRYDNTCTSYIPVYCKTDP